MKNHLIVFFCFDLIDFHIKSFENLKSLESDFFIVENISSNSKSIESYFMSEKNRELLIGYIRFEKNTSNALMFFIRDFQHILEKYEYITITDGDLLFDDPLNMQKEVFKNLNYSDVAISSVDMKLDNLPNIPGAQTWVPKGIINQERQYNEQWTGIHFMTFKKNNLYLLQNIRFLDSNIANNVARNNKKWVKTISNKAYHMTWDMYNDRNDYYQWKVKVVKDHWTFNPHDDSYIILI